MTAGGPGPGVSPGGPVYGAEHARPRAGTWVLGAAALYLASVGLVTGGLSGLFLVVGVIGLATASHALLTGRRTWALIPSRGVAAGCLAAGLAMTSIGAALLNPVIDPNLAAGSASTATAPVAGADSDAPGETAGEAAAPTAQKAPAPPPAEISMAQAEVTPPVIDERRVIDATTDTFAGMFAGPSSDTFADASAMTLLELPARNTCRTALPSNCRIPD